MRNSETIGHPVVILNWFRITTNRQEVPTMTVKGLLSEELIMERVKDVFDPEIHMSIVELGLVYGVDVTDDGVVTVTYTLTSPGCPLGAVIDGQIKDVLVDLPGVKEVV